MELFVILLGVAGLGYLLSQGSRTSIVGHGDGGAGPYDCPSAINTLPDPLRTAVQSAVNSPAATQDSLMNLAKTLDSCPYPSIQTTCTFVAACIRAEAAKRSGPGVTTPPVTSGADDATCSNMINALPEGSDEEKAFKTSVQTVWNAPKVDPTATINFANTLDTMADTISTSDPTGSARLKLIATCMRTKAMK